jgi:hypothetical protein
MNFRRYAPLWVVAAAILASYQVASSQVLSYSRGQTVSPAFEGWEENPDGSFNMMFGYMNRNWEEEIDVPIGPDNNISPGVPDQGQPTHFLPRRNRFVFKVRVPKDWGKKELVWTLTSKGKTERAFGTLATDAKVDNLVQASEQGAIGAGISSPAIRANIAPELTMDEGERRAELGKPLTLIAYAKDDGVPRPRYGPGSLAAERIARAAQTPPSAITVGSQTGLRHSCFVYRGAGRVRFDPPQHKVWEDTRAGANSPWAWRWMAPAVPPEGKYMVNVYFDDPGTYTIRCMASDGALNTPKDVVVTVK